MVKTNFLGHMQWGNDGKPKWTPMTANDSLGDFMVAHGKNNYDNWDCDGEKPYSDRDNQVEKRSVTNAAGDSYPCF